MRFIGLLVLVWLIVGVNPKVTDCQVPQPSG
jgi:hypothetical protein